MQTRQIIMKESKVQIICIHKEMVVEIPQFTHKGLFLKLARSYSPSGMTPEALYDATRKEWKINSKRTSEIEYVFALYNNEIVEIYKPLKWYANLETGRLMFEGELAPINIRQQYLGYHISAVEGVRNPVIYNF